MTIRSTISITAKPTRPLVGVGLMLLAMALLPFLDVLAKFLGQQGLPIMVIVWARMVFGTMLTLPFALRIGGPRRLLPDRPLLHLTRAGLLIAATFFFFFALKFLPIADALAIFFVQPLIVTVLSPWVLGEKVGMRRWTAVVIGFIGTLIIIRPGVQEVNVGVILALAAGASLGLLYAFDAQDGGPGSCFGHHIPDQPGRRFGDLGPDAVSVADADA